MKRISDKEVQIGSNIFNLFLAIILMIFTHPSLVAFWPYAYMLVALWLSVFCAVQYGSYLVMQNPEKSDILYYQDKDVNIYRRFAMRIFIGFIFVQGQAVVLALLWMILDTIHCTIMKKNAEYKPKGYND